MLQPRIDTEVVDRSNRTGTDVGCAEHHLLNSGVHRRSGAHGAGFERADEGCVIESPRSELFAGVPHCEYLGVGGWVTGELPLIVARGNDIAVDKNKRSDRYIAVGNRQLGFG